MEIKNFPQYKEGWLSLKDSNKIEWADSKLPRFSKTLMHLSNFKSEMFIKEVITDEEEGPSKDSDMSHVLHDGNFKMQLL